MLKNILMVSIGFLCALIVFSATIKKAICQTNMSSNVSFSVDNSSFYFFDKDGSKVYKYSLQGKLIHTYVIKELGNDLVSK
jgi:hypothetical protein